MKLVIGNDHAGVDLKNMIKEHLRKQGHEVINIGTNTLDSVDYPDIAKELSKYILKGKAQYGILICGTGIGIGIAANKVPGIRAALCSDTFSAHATREHNDANILTLGERVVGKGLAIDIVKAFLCF